MIVRGNLKKYIGAIEDEDVAGVLYDKYAIIIQGLQVSQIKAFHKLFGGLTHMSFHLCRPRRTTLTRSNRFWSLSTGVIWKFIKNLARKLSLKTKNSRIISRQIQYSVRETAVINRMTTSNSSLKTQSRSRCSRSSSPLPRRPCSIGCSASPN